ncbi:ammonium transmembrane transporter [Mactra antiquata]
MALEDEINQMFLIVSGMLVMLISGISYWLFGYAFAYGEGNDFIGYSNFAITDLPITSYATFFFQYSFAAATATIVSGSVAERCDFIAYLAYSAVITGVIYPICTHWQWGGGFLVKGVIYPICTHWQWGGGFLVKGVDYGGDIGRVGYIDFAGSGIVHMLGGAAGFVGAFMLGPRIGRFDPITKAPRKIRGHSIPVAALGGFILLFGFLAFNGGSLGSLTSPGDGALISLAVVNTVIGGSFGAFSAMFIQKSKKFGDGRWSLLMSINGALTGMVSTCTSVNAIYPWEACLLGLLAGPTYHITTHCVTRLKVDDPLEAVSVHFGGGLLGVFSAAFLHKDEGIFFNWNKRSGMVLLWQITGICVITAWTVSTSFILFGALKLLKVLRVPEDDEIKGLDIIKHNEPAYPIEAYGHGHMEKIIEVLSKTDRQKLGTGINSGMTGLGLTHLHDTGPYEHPEVRSEVHILQSTMNSGQQSTAF